MCFVWISEQTASSALYSTNWLVFITEMECVYCAVRVETSHIIQVNLEFLRVANAIKVFLCFTWSCSKWWIGAEIPHENECFSCSPSKTNFKFSSQNSAPPTLWIFRRKQPTKYKIQPKFSTSFLCCTLQNSPLPITLPSSLLSTLPSL
jgi:hypothetical protein